MAKLLHLSKRTRPDLQTAEAFLTTRVQHANEDDWIKLGPCLHYLRNTHGLPLIMSCDSSNINHWSIDATQMQLIAWDKDPFSHSPPNRKSTPGAQL